MITQIPLIRAGAVSPIIRWASERGKPIGSMLSEADMEYAALLDIDQLIPVRNVMHLLAILAEAEGVDIGCRIAFEADIEELGFVGRLALVKKTPREAMRAISQGMNKHCSHELITVSETKAGMVIGEGWSIRLEPAIHHMVQQYTASLIYRMIGLSNRDGPLFAKVSMVPHPKYGLAHLVPWFKIQPDPAENGYLSIEVAKDVADAPFAEFDLRQSGAVENVMFDTINPSLESALSTVMRLHMLDGRPSIDRMARAAGCSRRTLQRALTQLGTTFSDVLDDVRRLMAEQALEAPSGSRASLASALGYSRQSTLSHALRRWGSSGDYEEE